jgi:hypothetical protein
MTEELVATGDHAGARVADVIGKCCWDVHS